MHMAAASHANRLLELRQVSLLKAACRLPRLRLCRRLGCAACAGASLARHSGRPHPTGARMRRRGVARGTGRSASHNSLAQPLPACPSRGGGVCHHKRLHDPASGVDAHVCSASSCALAGTGTSPAAPKKLERSGSAASKGGLTSLSEDCPLQKKETRSADRQRRQYRERGAGRNFAPNLPDSLSIIQAARRAYAASKRAQACGAAIRQTEASGRRPAGVRGLP